MNILELIEESHRISREKGFWDIDKNSSETVLMIIANVGQIVKARNSGKTADWTAYAGATAGLSDYDRSHLQELNKAFETHIKDSFEDEIANVIIRICDFMGGTEFDVEKEHPWVRNYVDFPLNEFFLHAQVSGRYNGHLAEWLQEALWECASYPRQGDNGLMNLMCYLGSVVSESDIDIGRHIEAKLAYNKTRPKRYKKTNER